MAYFIDSHAHLADPAFAGDGDDAVERARRTGALGIVCIGESLAAAARARQVAQRFPGYVTHTAGVHPHDADTWESTRDLDAIRAELEHGAVAVGECGLDYHYDHAPRDQQRRAFTEQLALAQAVGRPVVVHTREAVDDTAGMVREAGAQGIRGVLHCFTGPASLAEAAIDAGWYLSFSGVITFRKWSDEALVRLVPADRILVESDAPYLAPVPHRGKRNEPAYVSLTLSRAAEMRGETPHALGLQSARNAVALFGLAIEVPAA